MNTKQPQVPGDVPSTPADGSADDLLAALTPMADGCAKTAILAFSLCGAYSKNAALALNLASETLSKINALMRDEQNE